MRSGPTGSRIRTAFVLLALSLAGCTSWREYFANGLKVGPNYCPPPAPVAEQWIEAGDKRVRSETADISQWWCVFDDPVLDGLVDSAYRQNLTLREAGFRVLQARAQRNIAVGQLFPQTQVAEGDYAREGLSKNTANFPAGAERWFDQWDFGFALAWELDFWGRFRRAIESADAELDASVADYDDVLVTLVADVATNYVEIRTLQQRLALARASVTLFEKILTVPEARYKADSKNRVSYDLAKANLAQAQALVPQLEISERQAENRLCILLGMPPQDLAEALGTGSIPSPPMEVAAGIPADLLSRRPDVRRAERQAAAQCARIGIAESDFYPQIAVTGTLGWSSEQLSDLFTSGSFNGSVAPGFRWNILNYGRILNHVRAEDARFQQAVTAYQQTVLQAAGEVEDALVSFVKSHERAEALEDSAAAWRDGTNLLVAQYRGELIDFVPVGYFQQNLLQQQDLATQAQGDVALALIDAYRALGGGWQVRLGGWHLAAGPVGPDDAAAMGANQPAEEALPSEALPLPDPELPMGVRQPADSSTL